MPPPSSTANTLDKYDSIGVELGIRSEYKFHGSLTCTDGAVEKKEELALAIQLLLLSVFAFASRFVIRRF